MTNLRLRNWCFTINNPDERIVEYYKNMPADEMTIYHIKYLVVQLERGQHGTRHLQGYLEFDCSMRFNWVKRNLVGFRLAHIEARRGTRLQASMYCQKPNSRVEGPWIYGDFGHQGARTDLETLRDDVLTGSSTEELLMEHPHKLARYSKFVKLCMEIRLKRRAFELYKEPELYDKRKVNVLIGKSGSGKTRYIYDKHDIEEIYKYCPSGGSRNAVWFDGYEGQKIILIDDFCGEFDWVLLLNILQKYPIQVQVKGGFTWLTWMRIYITSNFEVEEWYPDIEDITPLERRINRVLYVDDYTTPRKD